MSAHEFNLYESLELPMDATEQDIITSYRRLARIHHPDKNPNDTEATARFQRVSIFFLAAIAIHPSQSLQIHVLTCIT